MIQRRSLLATPLALGLASPAIAQAPWPNRPVRVIVGFPPGGSIDASRVDAWEFPVGTKVWKEFGYGKAIETRMIERVADGSWRFATYVWNADGSDAVLAPEDGAVVAVCDAPGGRYAVPGRGDCVACHEGSAVPVLGFTALQLSPDRDPLAPLDGGLYQLEGGGLAPQPQANPRACRRVRATDARAVRQRRNPAL